MPGTEIAGGRCSRPTQPEERFNFRHRAYLAPERFAAFRLEYGELVWGDYALCFPVADLYLNRLVTHDLLEAA